MFLLSATCASLTASAVVRMDGDLECGEDLEDPELQMVCPVSHNGKGAVRLQHRCASTGTPRSGQSSRH